MSRAASHTQAEIERALRAAKAVFGEKNVAGVEITAAGALRILFGKQVDVADLAGKGGSDWDDVLAV